MNQNRKNFNLSFLMMKEDFDKIENYFTSDKFLNLRKGIDFVFYEIDYSGGFIFVLRMNKDKILVRFLNKLFFRFGISKIQQMG